MCVSVSACVCGCCACVWPCVRACVAVLTTKMDANVGHALLPKTDLSSDSRKMNTFGTQIANASIAMMRSRSNLVCNSERDGASGQCATCCVSGVQQN